MTAPDKDHTCGTCGRTVQGRFCPICFAKWDPGSDGPEPLQYCFDCLEKHLETHKPDLTCVKIWKLEPTRSFRIEVGDFLGDVLNSEETLGVMATWLLNGAGKDGIHRFLRTRQQERLQERDRTERYINANQNTTGDTPE